MLYIRTLFGRFFVLLCMTMQTNHAVATSPPYVPPTLAQQVKDSDLIVVARVGRLKYMKWPSEIDSRGVWEVSDIPADGFKPYLNLTDIKVIRSKPPTNDAQRMSEAPDLPLWAQLGRCFPYTGGPPAYPPTGETRIFFLSRKLLSSGYSLHVSNCRCPSIQFSDLADVLDALRQSESTKK